MADDGDDGVTRGRSDAYVTPVVPLPAASVLLLRDSPLEVLLIERSAQSSFVPGAWVFPGGGVDPTDSAIAAELGDPSVTGVMRVTAVRELFEETGIWLSDATQPSGETRRRLSEGTLAFPDLIRDSPPALDRLVQSARWITPAGIPKRFDTWFFVAAAPEKAIAIVDSREAVASLWITPAEALRRSAAGELAMVLPTIRNLESIRSFLTVSETIEHCSRSEIHTVEPVLSAVKGRRQIIIPGE